MTSNVSQPADIENLDYTIEKGEIPGPSLRDIRLGHEPQVWSRLAETSIVGSSCTSRSTATDIPKSSLNGRSGTKLANHVFESRFLRPERGRSLQYASHP